MQNIYVVELTDGSYAAFRSEDVATTVGEGKGNWGGDNTPFHAKLFSNMADYEKWQDAADREEALEKLSERERKLLGIK